MVETKCLVVLGAFFIISTNGKPVNEGEILKYENNWRQDGYDFQFETSNSIKRSEQGILVPGKEDSTLNVNGDFSFILPDGTPMYVTFTANEDGYRPSVTFGQGKATRTGGPPPFGLPQSAPIPSAAIASLTGGGLG